MDDGEGEKKKVPELAEEVRMTYITKKNKMGFAGCCFW